MNFIDKTIAYIAPERAYRRTLARQRLRSYEAASTGNRLASWGLGQKTLQNLTTKTIRERSRYLIKNNPYAARSLSVLGSYIVSRGITPHAYFLSGKRATKHEEILKKWADSTECDIQGKNTLYGLQALATKHIIRDGEVFIQKVFKSGRGSLPLKLKILSVDYLDDQKNGKRVENGIEYSPSGEIVAYWLYECHPEETTLFQRPKSKRIPAKDLIHAFSVEEAGQTRGVSWFAPVLVRMKDFDEYEDAELLRHKMAAAYVGFWRDLESEGRDDLKESRFPKNLTPGTILEAPSGTTLEFSNPPQSEGFSAFAEHSKMTQAIGLGIPYFLLSGDYSKINYSSSLSAMQTFSRYTEEIGENILNSQINTRIFDWFLETLSLLGINDEVKSIWTLPKRDSADPLKQFKAYQMAVESGFRSHQDIVRELGDDPDETYREIDESLGYINKVKGMYGKTRDSEAKSGGSAPTENSKPRKPDH